MVAGKKWRTSITKTEPNRLVIRGYEVEDLIGSISFAEAIHLLFTGELPSKERLAMLEAILVAFVDYGIVSPSVSVSRIASSVGTGMMQCAAAGLIAFSGPYHGGAIEFVADMLSSGVREANESGEDLVDVARKIVRDHLIAGKRVPGYGHPINKERDPRTDRLIEIAESNGFSGPHLKLCRLIKQAILEETGKNLVVNPTATVAAILLDMGYDRRLIPAFNAISRVVGLLAHAFEERVREPVFRSQPIDEIEYDGPEVKRLTSKGQVLKQG